MYGIRGAYVHAGWDRGSRVCMRPEVYIFMRVGTEVDIFVCVCETGGACVDAGDCCGV